LNSISCEFKPGLTAIVGTNGAGKSTLVKLVAGLFPPTTGTIHAVGSNRQNVDLSVYVKSVLFQDPGHFPFSIRHNVTMQFDQTPGEDERIEAALRQAGLWQVVQTFPNRLETVVGAGFGGITDLSGGQWQRLALARLLYHNSPVIETVPKWGLIAT
jgi:ATP-binding cassette, subfamily B, bacterial